MPLKVQIIPLEHGAHLPHPAHATKDSAGVDLYAALNEPLILEPGARLLVPTGITIAIPQGYEGQIRPRSGLAYKNGVTVLNAPGTIDADYRGEVKVLLINHSKDPFTIEPSMRIAQLVISSYERIDWLPVSSFDEITQEETPLRKQGGFGSTGGF